MIPKDILKQVRKIEIRSGKLVNEIFAGQYSSVFKGRGMEFAEVREYLPGDDVRTIDWNVTARYGKPFVKKFMEERELTVIFLIDASASQRFGTKNKFKAELAAELASILSFSALRNNDRAGMAIFTDKVEKVIRPKKGRNHVLRMIREALYFTPAGKGTDIAAALQYLNELWRRRAVVFLVSDFEDYGFERALKVTAKRHDLIAIQIADPGEDRLPDIGMLELEDAETGQQITVDTSDQLFRREWEQRKAKKEKELDRLFSRAKVDHIRVTTDQPYIVPLMQFFKARERRIAG
jgi:uncharacterized protein (DUF58 family)